MVLDLDEVCRRVEDGTVFEYDLESSISWYTRTWQLSYVWVRSVRTEEEVTFEEFLSYVYSADPTYPTVPLKGWLNECVVEDASKSDLESLLAKVEAHLRLGSKDLGRQKGGSSLPIGNWALSSLRECFKLENAYKFGPIPTDIIAWQSGDWMHCCEVHSES